MSSRLQSIPRIGRGGHDSTETPDARGLFSLRTEICSKVQDPVLPVNLHSKTATYRSEWIWPRRPSRIIVNMSTGRMPGWTSLQSSSGWSFAPQGWPGFLLGFCCRQVWEAGAKSDRPRRRPAVCPAAEKAEKSGCPRNSARCCSQV